MANPDNKLIKRKHLSILYGMLAALGVALYISWGLLYGVWFDLGLYAVTVVMVGFGVIGFFLYSVKEEEETR